MFRLRAFIFFVLVLSIYFLPIPGGPLKAIPAFVIVTIYFAFSGEGIKSMGFDPPSSWVKTIAYAFVLAILIFLLRSLVIEYWIQEFIPEEKNLSFFREDSKEAAMPLGFWIVFFLFFAAIPEEVIWRGFLLPVLSKGMGGSKPATIVSLVVVSVAFGIAHKYQGMAGIVSTGIGGLIYGIVYLLDSRSLWKVILIHWMINSFSMIVYEMGW